jgi:predicted methyltransferase
MVEHPDAARTLQAGPPGDPRATERAVQRFTARALSGGAIDDVIRSELTVTSALWLLARLHREGVVRVDDRGFVHGTGIEAAQDVGLVSVAAVTKLVDWSVMDGVLARRGFDLSEEFFQSFETSASLRRRLAIMDHHGDLAGRTILQLGDDELFSVALGLVQDVAHVHVVDADPRVLAAIATEANSLGLPVSTHRVDVLRERVPVDGVDTFFVSCLKDVGGLTVCVANAVAATAGAGSSGYVSFDLDVYKPGLADREIFRDVARMLDRLDCVVTALVEADEFLLGESCAAGLGGFVAAAAEGDPTPLEVGEQLREFADNPRWGPLTLRNGYPDVPFRCGFVARVETGRESLPLAHRTLRFLLKPAGLLDQEPEATS